MLDTQTAGVPQNNPCLNCADRNDTCHATCRKYFLWQRIKTAHRTAYKKMRDTDFAPSVDMIERSRSMRRGGDMLVAQVKRKNSTERKSTK